MHLREYLHPRARSCSGRRVSSPPPTATFPGSGGCQASLDVSSGRPRAVRLVGKVADARTGKLARVESRLCLVLLAADQQ